MLTAEQLNKLGDRVLDAAFAVHSTLGPGLLEGTYQACLVYELRKRGLEVKQQVECPVLYDGTKMTDVGYRVDILVEDELILELKGASAIAPEHIAQLLTYLKHSGCRLGYVPNFHAVHLRDGINRQVNRL